MYKHVGECNLPPALDQQPYNDVSIDQAIESSSEAGKRPAGSGGARRAGGRPVN